MNKKILFILLLSLLFVLTGCTTNKYVDNTEFKTNDNLSGIIVKKFHIPANNRIERLQVGNEYREVELDDPEQWVIRIERAEIQENGDIINYNTDVFISVEEWHSLKLGDEYTIND